MKTLFLSLLVGSLSFSAFSSDYLCYPVTGKGKTAETASAELHLQDGNATITLFEATRVNAAQERIELNAVLRSKTSSLRNGAWANWSLTDLERSLTTRLSTRLLSENAVEGKTFLSLTDANNSTVLRSWAWLCKKK